MYLEYWGFLEFPFENVPDPRFFYRSKTHEEGLTRLIYAAKMRKGGAMLSGEIGCGKTTLAKVFVQELSEDKYDIGFIINPKLEPIEFLKEVLHQLGVINVPDTKFECLRILNEKLIENMKVDKETLLMVDEAHVLTHSILEEIRLLLNFQLNDRFLLTIILLGQPELKEKIRGIEQLDQRIPLKYHLSPFDNNDTARYILSRQKRAGKNENLFSRQAIEMIYDHTKGVPRKINNLCDLCLLVGFGKNEKVIHPETIERVINDGTLL